MILGLDPGRDKCGLAIAKSTKQIVNHQIVDSERTVEAIAQLCQDYPIDLIVMGDGTTSQAWYQKIQSNLVGVSANFEGVTGGLTASVDRPNRADDRPVISGSEITIVTVDERNSTLEARDRYWQMYPPQGWRKIIPPGLRMPPRPVDDIVAILLIERYWASRDR